MNSIERQEILQMHMILFYYLYKKLMCYEKSHFLWFTDIAATRAKGIRPKLDENGDHFARRLLDDKYGKGNYDTKSQCEYSKIKKWRDRAFE